MLRQSLKGATPDPAPLLAAAGIPETARAEEVPVAGFVAPRYLREALDPAWIGGFFAFGRISKVWRSRRLGVSEG
jgi:hypothetical protein